MINKQFRVENMHCANCALRLESLEDRLPGISSIEASYRAGLMTVSFDETLISEAQIIAAVEQLGYTARPA